jgi:two-component system cell cycle response regulator
VGRQLRGAGYAVDEAGDGVAALHQLEAHSYDVVITDLKMPALDGLGVLAAVKLRAIGTEVIILTGTHAQDMDCAVRALRLGAHDYLTKPPSSAEEVILTVDRAIEKKRLRDSNFRLLRELETLSRTDALTGLSNRRSFDEALPREESRAKRYAFPLSLVMFDIDHFKKVNDKYGHPGGDEVLRGFGRLVAEQFRDSDLVFRYGGEEFAALLPHTSRTGGLEAAQRLVEAVAETPVRLADGTMLEITCSAGVGCLVRGSGADLVAEADGALYQAKQQGRNRAVTAGPQRPKLTLAAV